MSALRTQLNWTQYKILLGIEDEDKRTFYIAESVKNNWSSRQKKIHIEGDDFFIDLVFFNRILKCFVIIEIKTEKLTHQHLGQLQMYVNYFDRTEKFEDENKTIGILLCADKNDSVVKFSLPENSHNIIGSKYQLYLPTENQLLTELEKELNLFLDKRKNNLLANPK